MRRTSVELTQQCSMIGGVFMTYYVDIDLAKYQHECLIMYQDGEVVSNAFTFDNNKQGFTSFLSVLSCLNASHQIRIGFEATGHYGTNLKNFLTNHGYDFMEIHPVLISRFSKASSLRKTKTDKIDVHLISSYLTTVEYKPYLTQSYHNTSLKSLTRSRDALVKERSLQLQRCTNLLDHIFPEFKPFFNQSLASATCQYLLINYSTPSKMSRMNQNSYDKMKSKLRRTISYVKFLKLRELAKNTVGVENPLLEFQLVNYITLYTTLDRLVAETETLIVHEFSKVPAHLQSIPGVGIISAASIYSEIENFNRFNHPDKLVAFCGLDPAFYQSGESAFTGKMVKRGSSYLRQYIMNSAQTVIIHNPTMYEFYLKKRHEGKQHRVALSHVAKKLLRVIFKLENDHINFDSTKMI